ncbi:hypothetical protein ACRAWD_21840 [Caulobacter segnis]
MGSHKFDENLAEVSLITRDAFEPTCRSRSWSISTTVKAAAGHPTVRRHQEAGGADARPHGQRLFQEHRPDPHADRTAAGPQRDPGPVVRGDEDQVRLYNLELQEVLIGTPRPAQGGDDQIEKILTQLRQRQIADEQVGTYERQKLAAQKERELPRPKPSPSSRPRSPKASCRSRCSRTRARPAWPVRNRRPSSAGPWPRPTPTHVPD